MNALCFIVGLLVGLIVGVIGTLVAAYRVGKR